MSDFSKYTITYKFADNWQEDIEVHASTKADAKAQAINEIKGKIRIVDVVKEPELSDSDLMSAQNRT